MDKKNSETPNEKINKVILFVYSIVRLLSAREFKKLKLVLSLLSHHQTAATFAPKVTWARILTLDSANVPRPAQQSEEIPAL